MLSFMLLNTAKQAMVHSGSHSVVVACRILSKNPIPALDFWPFRSSELGFRLPNLSNFRLYALHPRSLLWAKDARCQM